MELLCTAFQQGPFGPELAGEGKYCAAVAVNGFVYGIPYNASRVLEINSATGEVRHIGPELEGEDKYITAVAVDGPSWLGAIP